MRVVRTKHERITVAVFINTCDPKICKHKLFTYELNEINDCFASPIQSGLFGYLS